MTLLTWTISDKRPTKKSHLKQAEAAIIVCDITKPETVDKIPYWADRIQNIAGNIPIFFAAINTHIEHWEKVVWLRDLTRRYNSTFFPIIKDDLASARNLFRTIAEILALDFIERKKFDVGPGDSWCIPGDVAHHADVIDDSIAIEVFSPVREDFLPS